MRSAKILAKEALARRSMGVMLKTSEAGKGKESATKELKKPQTGGCKSRIVPD
jgi:hypothetical protein